MPGCILCRDIKIFSIYLTIRLIGRCAITDEMEGETIVSTYQALLPLVELASVLPVPANTQHEVRHHIDPLSEQEHTLTLASSCLEQLAMTSDVTSDQVFSLASSSPFFLCFLLSSLSSIATGSMDEG